MAANKKATTITLAGLQTLRIGARVRCADGGVEGRIVWANGLSVKIKWDDGEQVTWRRDSLAERPVEILAGDDEEAAAPAVWADREAAAAPDVAMEPPLAEVSADEPSAAQSPPEATDAAQESLTTETWAAEPTAPPAPTDAAPVAELSPAPESAQAETGAAGEAAPVAQPKRQRQAPTDTKEKKLSALDAAAKVLVEAGRPMSCQEMIEAMGAKKYWTSPGGKTPAGTLYSAILREMQTRGEQARFTKAHRGKFALRDRA